MGAGALKPQGCHWQLLGNAVLEMVCSVPKSDTVQKIQVLGDAGMCLKPHPPWPPGSILHAWTKLPCLGFWMILNVSSTGIRGLPWWSSNHWTAFQCRGRGFNPWSGKVPHAEGQLSLLLNASALEPCSMTREAMKVRSWWSTTREWPLLASSRES